MLVIVGRFRGFTMDGEGEYALENEPSEGLSPKRMKRLHEKNTS